MICEKVESECSFDVLRKPLKARPVSFAVDNGAHEHCTKSQDECERETHLENGQRWRTLNWTHVLRHRHGSLSSRLMQPKRIAHLRLRVGAIHVNLCKAHKLFGERTIDQLLLLHQSHLVAKNNKWGACQVWISQETLKPTTCEKWIPKQKQSIPSSSTLDSAIREGSATSTRYTIPSTAWKYSFHKRRAARQAQTHPVRERRETQKKKRVVCPLTLLVATEVIRSEAHLAHSKLLVGCGATVSSNIPQASQVKKKRFATSLTRVASWLVLHEAIVTQHVQERCLASVVETKEENLRILVHQSQGLQDTIEPIEEKHWLCWFLC